MSRFSKRVVYSDNNHFKLGFYLENSNLREKADFLQIALKYAAPQSENSHPKVPDHTETLKTMNYAIDKMALAIGLKPRGLERLTVPNWDGSQRTYQMWKREFTHCMKKYGQDKDEQLQRF